MLAAWLHNGKGEYRTVKITSVVHYDEEALIRNLRNIEMLKAPQVHPYESATITLEILLPEEIVPPQRYVLTDEILKVRDLQWELQDRGVDLFKLDGYVTIMVEDCDYPIDVLPPIVEESKEADGSVVRILNDGMHRVYLARVERTLVQAVYVTNIPGECPYYAFPLVNGWNGVELRSDLPEDYIKKWHRIREYHELYRNFNSGGFQNVGGPRPRTPAATGG
jgi:hypothetical protein